MCASKSPEVEVTLCARKYAVKKRFVQQQQNNPAQLQTEMSPTGFDMRKRDCWIFT